MKIELVVLGVILAEAALALPAPQFSRGWLGSESLVDVYQVEIIEVPPIPSVLAFDFDAERKKAAGRAGGPAAPEAAEEEKKEEAKEEAKMPEEEKAKEEEPKKEEEKAEEPKMEEEKKEEGKATEEEKKEEKPAER